MSRISAGLASLALALASPASPSAAADPPAATTLLDRVIVRWHAPETGGPARPQFIFERELAFEARLEALADTDPEPGPYHERHVRTALERHIAESLLASLPVVPAVEARVIAARVESARGILEQRVHGRSKLVEAAVAEGIGAAEIDAMLRRQALASLYLHKMIAPMLEPSELELRDLWRTGATPFKEQPFESVRPYLAQWYVGQRLGRAFEAYFQNARSRVVMVVARRSQR